MYSSKPPSAHPPEQRITPVVGPGRLVSAIRDRRNQRREYRFGLITASDADDAFNIRFKPLRRTPPKRNVPISASSRTAGGNHEPAEDTPPSIILLLQSHGRVGIGVLRAFLPVRSSKTNRRHHATLLIAIMDWAIIGD